MRFSNRIATALTVAALWAPSSAHAVCGDGVLEAPGEACDDGSQCTDGTDCTADSGLCSALPDTTCAPLNWDGCPADCTAIDIGWDCTTAGQPCTPICGDSFVVGNEECDDTGESATCDIDCTDVSCGDGTTNNTAGEDCDDAGESATCDRDCTNAVCNDGTVNIAAGEMCDDGNNANNDGCASDCSAIEGGFGCPTPGQPCIAEQCGDCSLLLQDNFSDDLLDPSKWSFDTGNTDSVALETNQQLELTNGGLLLSKFQLEPIASGGLSIQATWIIGALDDVIILTRASRVPGSGGIPDPAVRAWASEELDTIGVEMVGAGIGTDTALLTINAGDELLFELVDDGDNVNLMVTNVTQGSTSATVSMVQTDRHPESYVVFANRLKDTADYMSVLDDVTVSTLNNFACKTHGCDVTTQSCADVNFVPSITCDDRNASTSNDACDGFGACRGVPLTCGDGVIDTGEQCDDGTGNNSDTVPNACRTNCASAHCGDAVTDSGEDCDQGYINSDTTPDTCRESCSNPRCGDGVVDATVGAGEVCDDANLLSGDGCTFNCAIIEPGWDCSLTPCFTTCGDGITAGTEECDDGAANSDTTPDTCRANCTNWHCGDSVVDTGEQCDLGPGNSDSIPDTCRTDCQDFHCGDSVVDSTEGCDDGNTSNDDGCAGNCSAYEAGWDCTVTPCVTVCGDGIIIGAEECDDGGSNGNQADTCRVNCTNPRCGDGIRDTGEDCDDGNDGNNDGCLVGCIAPVCGDGFIFPVLEECDDGLNNSDTAADQCRVGCTLPRCGDRVVDSTEECDDGNRASFDGCSSLCTIEVETTGPGGSGGSGGEEPQPGGCSGTGGAGLTQIAGLGFLALVGLRRKRRRHDG